ncbi:MAG: zinc ribbon domain-containing protein [Chloroflexota bacterium]|nr:zinc ribbon domain-containing protein [Chloroflexota bacterium]
MPECTACGSDLPEHARFCGRCGQVLNTGSSNHQNVVIQNPPPASEQSAAAAPSAGVTLLSTPGEHLSERITAPLVSNANEQAQRPLLVLADAATPFMPAAWGPAATGMAPMAQGIPQLSGVAMAQGGPATFSSLPATTTVASKPATTWIGTTTGKIVTLLIVSVVVIGGGLAVYAAYILTRPQPAIGVTSAYKVGTLPAGASGTSFHISGHTFSDTSAVTLLLDGRPVPGQPRVQSDAQGNFRADLAVTTAWSPGRHTITARDASDYATKKGTAIIVVSQGQANTPGPHGAPADDANFRFNASLQGQYETGTALTAQRLLIVTGQPDPAGGTVCAQDADGTPHTITQTASDGSPFRITFALKCSGTYKGGKFSYDETITQGTIVFISSGTTVTCTLNGGTRHFEGTFSHGTGSGTFSYPHVTSLCNQPSASAWLYAANGTWSGTLL